MKKFLIIAPILAIIIAYASNRSATISPEGIKFYSGSITEAIKQSEVENKPIFIDVSTSWCGWCKKMKRNAFSDKVIGNYFNSHFINVAIDAEQGEGPIITKQFGVNSFPTLLVIDKNEKVILYSAGYLDSETLMAFGNKAINNFKQTNSK